MIRGDTCGETISPVPHYFDTDPEVPSHPREVVLRLPEAAREQVIHTLRLAEQLGAETVTLSGQSVSEEILTYARTRNVSKIVVGKPLRPRWREIVFGSVIRCP